MSENETEIRSRILNASRELFFSYGIRSITMADIARHLSISKKTIYRFFSDKDEIVQTLSKENMERRRQCTREISGTAKDPIDEMLRSMSFMAGELRRIHPNLIYDLQKFHPFAWQEFKKFSEEHMMQAVTLNLRRGVKLGLYRANISIPVLARLRIEQVKLAMNPQVFPPQQYELKKVGEELVMHFLYGILTTKGHRLLRKYQSHKEQKKIKQYEDTLDGADHRFDEQRRTRAVRHR